LFDAEHFYQGFKEDPEYALEVVRTAEGAGASVIILADTTGSSTPMEVYNITMKVVESVSNSVIGLHMHNDIGCAVANTLAGVMAGARHVQGTINGIGERTGNADLIQVLPTLAFKMGFKVLKSIDSFKKLKELSLLVYKIIGIEPNPYQPYVGAYAFAHKAGIHVDAILKNPKAYEHIDPSIVGNNRVFIVSELSGASNIVALLKELGIDVNKKDEKIKKALIRIKNLEKQGYAFNVAPASAVLEILKELGVKRDSINRYSWTVFTDSTGIAIAIVNLNDINNRAMDVDAITALKKAFEGAIQRLFIEYNYLKIRTFSIHLLSDNTYRATVEFSNGLRTWTTQVVSINIMDAFSKALIDGIEYYNVIKTFKNVDIVTKTDSPFP
jgi:2-isopropylmalate synthase